MAGYGFYNYGNATANTPASAVGDTLVGAFNKANLNTTNMRFPNQWGSSALLGAEGKPYQSMWAFNDPSQQGVVAPINTSTAMFQHDMMKGVPQFGTQGAAAPSLLISNQPSGWSSMFAPDTFQGLGIVATPAPTQKEFSLSPTAQRQVQQPQQQLVQVQTATADVQPTVSQPISPIGVQSVTNAMNAQPTIGNTIPQSANTEGWFGTAKSWLGDKFGVDATQYLTNPDGTIMMSKEGVPMVNADATSWGDVGAGLMGTAQIGLGAYNMFTGMDQQQQALDTQRGQLNLMREKYAEDKRKNQAIVAQNRGA